ncbi:hypothetical protein SCT_1818 [Sulfuricella sp. T08]|uniref:hypothetical protein n=1 Tax=Sulfuricella sp. T08 TaxID=1632857 RepID=UPI0006179DD0|nr:hypothetical protein [Sulfuricella sp. T08]GAO36412.1 hypothetical protein SCT_1818 [Sulfuricella sp. T08]
MKPGATPYKAITCFCPAGRGQRVLEELHKEMGINCAFVHHARGIGVGNVQKKKLFYIEREIFTVLVPVDRADEIFRFLYFATGIDEPHAGMIVMEKTTRLMPIVEPVEL